MQIWQFHLAKKRYCVDVSTQPKTKRLGPGGLCVASPPKKLGVFCLEIAKLHTFQKARANTESIYAARPSTLLFRKYIQEAGPWGVERFDLQKISLISAYHLISNLATQEKYQPSKLKLSGSKMGQFIWQTSKFPKLSFSIIKFGGVVCGSAASF